MISNHIHLSHLRDAHLTKNERPRHVIVVSGEEKVVAQSRTFQHCDAAHTESSAAAMESVALRLHSLEGL
jgi:nucleoside phosphorylase